jgi:hypothetical protein
MDRAFTLKVVLSRLTYVDAKDEYVLNRVRTLIMGRESALVDIFTRACELLLSLEQITDDDEYASYIRIEEDDKLIALAALTHDSSIQNAPPYQVLWCREPSEEDVRVWQRLIQQLLDKGTLSPLGNDGASGSSADLKLSLIYNLMHTREYALPTDEVYPALYIAESRMGLNYARGPHMSDDLGV